MDEPGGTQHRWYNPEQPVRDQCGILFRRRFWHRAGLDAGYHVPTGLCRSEIHISPGEQSAKSEGRLDSIGYLDDSRGYASSHLSDAIVRRRTAAKLYF